MIKIWWTGDIAFLIAHILSFFSKPGAYNTHNATSHCKWHHWRQFIRLDAAVSGATKYFILLFLRNSILQDLQAHFKFVKLAELPFIT